MLVAKEGNFDPMSDAKKEGVFEVKEGEVMTVNSRFGELEIDLSKAIYFPKGLYGFKEDLHFALTDFPVAGLEEFKLLQCLNDHSISLPVIPAGYDNTFISDSDMEECLNTIEVKKENFAMLFIASSNKLPDGKFEVFINTKAPIVMDTSLKVAIQYIFTNNNYSVRHKITDEPGK